MVHAGVVRNGVATTVRSRTAPTSVLVTVLATSQISRLLTAVILNVSAKRVTQESTAVSMHVVLVVLLPVRFVTLEILRQLRTRRDLR